MTLNWEKYVPYFSTNTFTKVYTIKWRLDGTKIAAALMSDVTTSYFTILLLNPSDGSLYYAAADTTLTGFFIG